MSATNVGEQPRRPRARISWLWGVPAALLTPLVITGIFRILPETPLWTWWLIPFFVLPTLAAALWFVTTVPRSVSVGIIVGTVGWGLFLVWLIRRWSTMPFD